MPTIKEDEVREERITMEIVVDAYDESERALLRALAQFPRVVTQGAQAREPHRIAFFAHELATQFHSYWTRGKDQPHLRFVNENQRSVTEARLALAAGVRQALKSALAILGVGAPEEMR